MIFKPLFKNAISLKRLAITSQSISVVSVKISGSGQKVVLVPVLSVASHLSTGAKGSPLIYS